MLPKPPAAPLPAPPPVPLTHEVMQAVSAVDEAQQTLVQAQQRLEHAAVIATGYVPEARYYPCNRCGSTNRQGARFCNECGHPCSAAPPPIIGSARQPSYAGSRSEGLPAPTVVSDTKTASRWSQAEYVSAASQRTVSGGFIDVAACHAPISGGGDAPGNQSRGQSNSGQ